MLTLKEVKVFKVSPSKHENFTVPAWAKFVTISDTGTICAWKHKPLLQDGRWYGHDDGFVKPIGNSNVNRGNPEIIEIPEINQ